MRQVSRAFLGQTLGWEELGAKGGSAAESGGWHLGRSVGGGRQVLEAFLDGKVGWEGSEARDGSAEDKTRKGVAESGGWRLGAKLKGREAGSESLSYRKGEGRGGGKDAPERMFGDDKRYGKRAAGAAAAATD